MWHANIQQLFNNYRVSTTGAADFTPCAHLKILPAIAGAANASKCQKKIHRRRPHIEKISDGKELWFPCLRLVHGKELLVPKRKDQFHYMSGASSSSVQPPCLLYFYPPDENEVKSIGPPSLLQERATSTQ